MATGQWPSLLDLASRTVLGKQVHIAEMLSQSIALYDDLPMREANEVGGHEGVFRTSSVTCQFVAAGCSQGAPYSKSTTAKFRIGVGELVDYSQVDRTLAEDSGDIEMFRMNEDAAFLEGMGQTLEQTCFYGNTLATPQEFMGLSGFYNSLNSDIATGGAQNGANVIDAGGTGTSNASMWLLCLGERTIYGIFPRGSKVGLAMEDKGDVTPAFDAIGNRYEAFTSWFRCQMGLVPEDWRSGGPYRQHRRRQRRFALGRMLATFRSNGRNRLLPASPRQARLGHHQDRRADRQRAIHSPDLDHQ